MRTYSHIEKQGLPGPVAATVIGWRAKRICDPLDRLRYLARATRSHRGRGFARPRARGLFLLGVALAAPVAFVSDAHVQTQSGGSPPLRPTPRRQDAPSPVWLVERTLDYDAYSNGLRIENRLAVANQRRFYRPIDRQNPAAGFQGPSYEPAGIVFHATESYQAPFEPAKNGVLKETGDSLLHYVRRRRSYHFVIDRFARVHRIVAETDSANHAGRSIWADSRWVYLDLNNSFLGVSFEALTAEPAGGGPASKAQMRSAAMLVEMLRSKYAIAAENCVTHAQVSVNPDNWQLGYHTDFGNRFAFAEAGLPDNYGRPPAAVYLFGFTYAPTYVKATGATLWSSLALAEEQLRTEALARGVTLPEHRRSLRERYRRLAATVSAQSLEQPNQWSKP